MRSRWTLSIGLAIVAVAGGSIIGIDAARTRSAARLAGQDRLFADAPIHARASITVAAPKAVVWHTLITIDAWPRWQTDISAARLSGPVAPGSRFDWTTGGVPISSTIASVQPSDTILWSGHAFGLHSIHRWTLTDTAAGVRVTTEETMRGFPLSAFYSSEELRASLAGWLAMLKKTAEREP